MAPIDIYYIGLMQEKKSLYKVTKGVYGLPVCDKMGMLKKDRKCVIVQHIAEGKYECSCETGSLYDYTEEICIHVKAAQRIWQRFDFQNQETDTFKQSTKVCQLDQTSFFGVYSDFSNTYGILKKTEKTIRCIVCTEQVDKCVHKKAFKMNATPSDQATKAAEPVIFSSVSKDIIPYPLVSDGKETYMAYLNGKQYPKHLVPKYNESLRCQCGHLFKNNDPIASKWIKKNPAYIHLKDISLECIIYYRPTIGNCICHQEYDGRSELLINLNNKHIFSYAWMFDILHTGHETGYPIRSAFRSANRNREICSRGVLKDYFYDHLRYAFNAFIRLLDLGHNSNYNCDQCIDEGVKTVIMDGISMGCVKERMASDQEPPAPVTVQIEECKVKDRVFVNNEKTRKLLSTYSGLNNGVYEKPTQMLDGDYNKLINALSLIPSLKSLVEQAGNPCPQSLQKLLGELSHGSPTCGIIQIAGTDASEARHAVQQMANGDFSQMQFHSECLRKYAPMLVEFIVSQDVHQQHISSLLKDLLASIESPFKMPLPQQDWYGPSANAADMKLTYFPNHPPCRGKTNYAANKNKENQAGCRKESLKHDALSPGIFTMVCPHGVTLGFKIMDSPESPRIPFNILMCHFNEMPDLIIYDNACHLHLYALKREPTRFRNTRFMVDRLHYRNHNKCTGGYSMDSYASDHKIKIPIAR